MKSDYIYPAKVVKEAKVYDLNPDELAIADLVSCGWPKETAFTLVYRVGMAWEPKALSTEASEILNKTGAKKRRKENKERVEGTGDSKLKTGEKDILSSLSKENMLLDLAKARQKMVPGSKDWLDINKVIADLTRMKQDEVKTEDTTVHFYLPMQCHQCALYATHKNNPIIENNNG
jgi:hypothetical protein